MLIRTIRLFMVVCLAMAWHQSVGALEWKGCLSDEAYNKFIATYKVDPGAVSKNNDIFRQASSKQFHNIFTALGTTHFTYLYPVEIKSEELPDLVGKDIKSLSMMAVRGGRLMPVPYQIDEFDKTGLIYIKDISPYDSEGTPGIFDTEDELVFMFRDAGTVPYDPVLMACSEGQILKEIKLDTPRNGARYIYIVEGNSQRSDADYARVDLENGVIETTMYKIEYNPKNFAELRTVCPKVGPHYGQNAVDNVYARIGTGILSEKIRFTLNTQDNIHAIPIGAKDGPIRATILFKARMWYFGMPTPFKDYVNVNFYDQAMNVPSRFTMDTINSVRYFLKIIKRPTIEAAMDFHNLKGARYIVQNAYDPNKPDEMAIVDNKVSDVEKRINASRLPGEWVFLDTNQGWAVFLSNQLNFKPGGLIDEYLDGMRVNMVFEDNLLSTREYENYPGAEPRIGVSVEGMPYQAVNMLAALKHMNFDEIETIGDLVLELDRIGEKGDLKKMDKLTNEVLAKMKKNGTLKSKEDLIKIAMDDVKIFSVKGIEKEKLYSLIRRAMESEINEEMDNFNHYKLIHKLIELAKADDINFDDWQYTVTDTTLWFPDSLDEGGPENFNRQIRNPPEVNILPYNGRRIGKN